MPKGRLHTAPRTRSQVDIFKARIALAVLTVLAAAGLALLCLLRRAVTVPLQWLLALALFMRAVRQLFLMIPMLQAAVKRHSLSSCQLLCLNAVCCRPTHGSDTH